MIGYKIPFVPYNLVINCIMDISDFSVEEFWTLHESILFLKLVFCIEIRQVMIYSQNNPSYFRFLNHAKPVAFLKIKKNSAKVNVK